MTEQPTFDPRFDPAFQRGYVPPAVAPVIPAAPIPTVSIDEPDADDGEPDATAESQQEEAIAPEFAQRRGINPYLVILWVVGVILLLGGAVLLFVSYLQLLAGYSTGPSQSSAAQILYLFGNVFGVPAITVGLITIVGLIFFSAWRSSRRQGGT
ncbi:hypothetical protein [Parafrigoribacterium humi]|uniref:hypothetical protein n=1 Tax=Parafrigoribacterium humi TaxID=3144664 RepID=UPI0032EE6D4E